MSGTDPVAGDSRIPALDLATVERQVQQTGAYSVLEWLLESGVLPYPVYEQWRYGGVAFLEDALQAEASDWIGRLREGEARARALGLVNDPQAYHAEHPILLSRLAQALHQRQAPEAAMLAWARCCELAPQSSLADLVPEVAPRLHRRALDFEALDEPLAPHEFPAWLLLREPGLLHHLDRLDTPVPTGAAFLAMAELLRSRVLGADEVAARERLQQLSPALLRAYLSAKRGVSS